MIFKDQIYITLVILHFYILSSILGESLKNIQLQTNRIIKLPPFFKINNESFDTNFVSPCIPKSYKDGIVCICNSTYCDHLEPLNNADSPNQIIIYESNKAGLRFHQTSQQLNNLQKEGKSDFNSDQDAYIIKIDPTKQYQRIMGFGGALTDAAVLNFHNMSPGTQENLLASYFKSSGLGYNMIRVPMASSDFSEHKYTYDDVTNDYDLTNFALTIEDVDMKIPFIKRAKSMAPHPIKLFTAPWSGPAWLKTSNSTVGGKLKGEREMKTMAMYVIKFLESYKKVGLHMWGLSPQNEPVDGLNSRHPFQSTLYDTKNMTDYMTNYLCPLLKEYNYLPNNLSVMILDDNIVYAKKWANDIYTNINGSTDCVSGMAVHWYLNNFWSQSVYAEIHSKWPQYYILSTEACSGFRPFENDVRLGMWERGEAYAKDIANSLLHSVSGWVDWNLVLNPQGGPNWIRNFVDSPIIYNGSADEFYKQPMYYAMGHFSKFISDKAIRIDVEVVKPPDQASVKWFNVDPIVTAVDNIDNYVVIFINKQSQQIKTVIRLDQREINYTLSPKSFVTMIWPKT